VLGIQTNPVFAGSVGVNVTPTLNSTGNVIHVGADAGGAAVARFTRGTTGHSATNGLIVGSWSSGENLIWTYQAEPIIFATSSAERMRIAANGTIDMKGTVIGKTGTGGILVNQNDNGSFEAKGDASNAASISFHRPGIYAINMGLDTDNNFKIGGWSQGGTPYFQMNPSGHMILPNQPIISGSLTNTVSANGVANYFFAITNVGFTIGADRITVPSAGNYLINFNTISNYRTGRVDANIYINGAANVNTLTDDNGTGHQQRSLSIVRKLAANDFVTFLNTDWYANTATGYVEWRTFSITKLS
jgi:hypothetical protein